MTLSTFHSLMGYLDRSIVNLGAKLGSWPEDDTKGDVINSNSKFARFLKTITSKEFSVGASFLGITTLGGLVYKKYRNIKLTELQKKKMKVLEEKND